MSFVYKDNGSNVEWMVPVRSDVVEYLPARIYRFEISPGVCRLSVVRQNYQLPANIYGDVSKIADTIIKDYDNSPRGTSALLTGIKGTGKSLTSEIIANKMLQKGVPVLQIAEYIPPAFLKNIIPEMGPVVVIFDEFLKNYARKNSDEENQHMLLTLFSDSGLKKVMFLLLDNNTDNLSNYIINRPGRIKFNFRYFPDTLKIFREYSKNMPILKEVRNALNLYFGANALSQPSFGMDIIETVTNVGVGAESHNQWFERIQCLNVPVLSNVNLVVEKIEFSNQDLFKNVMAFPTTRSAYSHDVLEGNSNGDVTIVPSVDFHNELDCIYHPIHFDKSNTEDPLRKVTFRGPNEEEIVDTALKKGFLRIVGGTTYAVITVPFKSDDGETVLITYNVSFILMNERKDYFSQKYKIMLRSSQIRLGLAQIEKDEPAAESKTSNEKDDGLTQNQITAHSLLSQKHHSQLQSQQNMNRYSDNWIAGKKS